MAISSRSVRMLSSSTPRPNRHLPAPRGCRLRRSVRTFGTVRTSHQAREPSFRREAAANVPGQARQAVTHGPVSQGDRPRPELMAIHELELDAPAQTGKQRRPVSGKDRLHKNTRTHQSQICQRQGERHATHEQALAWLLLEPLNRLPQVASHQLGIPIDPAQRARHDVLFVRSMVSANGISHSSIQSGHVLPWPAAATPTPSSRRSPGRIAGHRLVPSQRSSSASTPRRGGPAS